MRKKADTYSELINNEAGLTLIEVLVVVVILSLFAYMVAPKVLGRLGEAKTSKAMVTVGSISQALSLYKLDNGTFPSTEQGLEALISKPTSGTVPERWKEGGYIEKLPSDPWKNPFIYIYPGSHGLAFDLFSYGADGEEGGDGDDADVGNWNLE